MKKTLTVLMMVLLAAMLVVSCTNNSKEPKTYTVKFSVGSGTGSYEDLPVKEGEKAVEPAIDPKAQNKYQTFNFWSLDGQTAYDFDDPVDSDLILTACYRDLAIGDIGPAGGIIFYVNSNSSDDWKYLEVASSSIAACQWCTSRYVNFITYNEVGSGESNTNIIKNAGISNYPAAKACVEYNAGGCTDWFLPSKAELALIRTNICTNSAISREVKALFPTEAYWTSYIERNSSDDSGQYTLVCYEVCTNTNGSSSPANQSIKVRPVRSF